MWSKPFPAPLLDRTEVIRLDGYTDDEKVAIARDHLLPRQIRHAGLEPEEIEVTEAALAAVVDRYTREAGVRSLERELGKLATEGGHPGRQSGDAGRQTPDARRTDTPESVDARPDRGRCRRRLRVSRQDQGLARRGQGPDRRSRGCHGPGGHRVPVAMSSSSRPRPWTANPG